jgi:hypothetical protein
LDQLLLHVTQLVLVNEDFVADEAVLRPDAAKHEGQRSYREERICHASRHCNAADAVASSIMLVLRLASCRPRDQSIQEAAELQWREADPLSAALHNGADLPVAMGTRFVARILRRPPSASWGRHQLIRMVAGIPKLVIRFSALHPIFASTC